MNTKLVYTCIDNKDNWFYNKYYQSGSNLRYFTFQLALNLLSQRHKSPVIIETGCQRQENDFGAGMSTSIFAEYISKYMGKLFVVDNNKKHLEIAKKVVSKWNNATIGFAHSDSVSYLKAYSGACNLLYLDSYDYPIVEMWNKYDGRTDLPKAIKILKGKTRPQLIKEFGDIILPCQEHCLNEFKAIEKRLLKNTILLIDDNDFPGGGKPGLLKPYLIHKGWVCLFDSQQTLWIKEL